MSRVLQCSSLLANVISARSCGRLEILTRSITSTSSVERCQKSPPLRSSTHLTLISSKHQQRTIPPVLTSGLHISSVIFSDSDEQKRQQPEADEEVGHDEVQRNDNVASPTSTDQSIKDDSTPKEVLDRLRILSMTPADEYQLSPKAREKAKEMLKMRREVIARGEQWKWDQTNLRPSGAPHPRPRYSQRIRGGWGEEEDDYGGGGRGRGFNSGGWGDEEDDYGGGGRSRGSNRGGWRGEEEEYGGSRRGRGFNRGGWEEEEDDFGGINRRGRGFNQDSWEDEENEFDGGRRGRGRGFQSGRGAGQGMRPQEPLRDFGGDEGEDYEVEMQKLRERMEQAKIRKQELSQSQSVKKSQPEATEEIQDSGEKSSDASKLSGRTKDKRFEYSSQASKSSEHWDSGSFSEDTHINTRNHDDSHSYYTPSRDNFNENSVASNPDTFGTISIGSTSILVKDRIGEEIQKELREVEQALQSTEAEEDDTRFVPPHGERWTTNKLITKVRDLLKEKKLKEAVDTFLGVLKEGGFQFNHDEIRHHFNVLINECADVGYVEMAFRLRSEMRARGFRDKPATVSSLLNACANAPWDPVTNVNRIDRLLASLQENQYELNLINYHALIKACGRLGETVRAFGVVDQIIQEGKHPLEVTTFNLLLQACISDTKNGFRHALITLKKMQSMGFRPDIFTYNLLLRSIRDCGVELKMSQIEMRGKVEITGEGAPRLLLSPGIEETDRMANLLILENPTEQETRVTNFVESSEEISVVDGKVLMKALAFPENRFAILGGIKSFISHMVRNKVGPNLKTLTALVEVLRQNEIVDVLRLLESYKIKPDQNFFVVCIKRCNELRAVGQAEKILKVMASYNITPNIVTWGALSLGCRTWPEAKSLLKTMGEANFTANIEVMGSLLVAAMRNHDPRYVLHVMEETRERKLPICDRFLGNLETYYKKTQSSLVSKEMGNPVEPFFQKAVEMNPEFGEHFGLFKMRYPVWLKSVDIKIDPKNPWEDQFQHFKKNKRHRREPESETLEFESESASSKVG